VVIDGDKEPEVLFMLANGEPDDTVGLDNSILQEFINPTGGLLNTFQWGHGFTVSSRE